MKKNNIQKMPKAGQAGNGTKPHVVRRDFSDFHDWEKLAKQLDKFEQENGWKTLFYAMLKYQRTFHKETAYNFGDAGR